ncbi:GMC oxidoreductase [Penicillium hispanicum]|uniref:GMC oxidoreductase n=1 Tax=Penicillium hispanicum TaxID=1080232 RepID=UPI002540D0CB|nr:GMC oxidoreductase [Penicillium hispanicum]KAJ5595497.1 GMC oxidoreductase [Penicillium hispanicum]
MASSSYDYIVVGGGLAGCVVAAKLHEKLPSTSILVIEVGEDQSHHPIATKGLMAARLQYSELDWDLRTVPQRYLNNTPRYQGAGKALGGSTAINYATWTRGPKVDYDRWATIVGDDRWSYDKLLPYFPKTQTRAGTDDASQPRPPGLIYTASPSESHPDRKYPLREPIRVAWESIGMKLIADPNTGYPLGLSERVENWDQGKRQFAHRVYDTEGVEILTKTRVARILVSDDKVAHGVELTDGRTIAASKEVILSAGSYHSPKILLLSGIGPVAELEKHGITQLVDSPEVGRNFLDHLAVPLIWKLKKREYDLPFSALANPVMSLGMPSDWAVFDGLNPETIRQAIAKDGNLSNFTSESLLNPANCFIETLNFYVPAGAEVAGMAVPMDGTYVSSPVLAMHPTSRGMITLASKDPLAPPAIDPNYYATEVDRAAVRAGIRTALRVYQDTNALRDIIEAEVPPEGYPPLRADSTDDEIDARVRRMGITFFHPSGSCAMGKVVDTELRAYGVKGLRVVDASVLPTPLAAHLQGCVYALAERAVDFIVGENL